MNSIFALATLGCLFVVATTDNETHRGFAFCGFFIAAYLTFGA